MRPSSQSMAFAVLFTLGCSKNPLPANHSPVADRECRLDAGHWSFWSEVVFGDVTQLEAVTEGALGAATGGAFSVYDSAECSYVDPVLELELAVSQSTASTFVGQTVRVRLGHRVEMDPYPVINDADQLAWQVGNAETAGEPLAVGRPLGLRLMARHPDGFWLAQPQLFTENDGFITFQKGRPCSSLRYSEEPVSSESFWGAVTEASTGLDPSLQDMVNVIAADEPTQDWLMWAPACARPQADVDPCVSDRECSRAGVN